MITIDRTEIMGFRAAIRGMRNPMNSWAKSDSRICYKSASGECSNCLVGQTGLCVEPKGSGWFVVGNNDFELMKKLAHGGPVHTKYRRMIIVYVDIVAPLYWWKEFDTYKVGTVANSCSTMHKIHEKEFTVDDFSHEDLLISTINILNETISMLNKCREKYLETKDKIFWQQMIQLLPSSYNQKRTVMMSYEVLNNIYFHRKNHKLDEWKEFCKWIEHLPCSELITCDWKEK